VCGRCKASLLITSPAPHSLMLSPLPRLVPVIFHGNKRAGMFADPAAVCLPLYKVINGNAAGRYTSSLDLAEGFRIAQSAHSRVA
jgi:hypothetical protein